MPSPLYEESLIPLSSHPGCLCSRTVFLTENSASFSRYPQPALWPPDLYICLHLHCLHLKVQWASQIQHEQLNSWHPPQNLLLVVFPTSVNGNSNSGHPWLLLISHPTSNPTTSSVSSTFKIFRKSHPFSPPPLPLSWSSHHYPLSGFVQ